MLKRETDRSEHAWPFAPADYPRIVGGEGAWLIADNGSRILDAAGGAIVSNIGHGRAEVVEAMANEAATSTYVVPNWPTPQREALVERLRRNWLPKNLYHIHLTSGGSEGVEAAIKIAFQYFSALGQHHRTKVIARDISYHGATITTAGLSGHAARKRGLEAILQKFPRIPTPYPLRSAGGRHRPGASEHYLELTRQQIEREGPATVAAIVIECISGSSGGAIIPPGNYLAGVREICNEHGILLIVDEVMTGFGRTGASFAVDHWNLTADILVAGKGLASGYAAICGVYVDSSIAQPIIDAGHRVMFHTFAALPSSCAAANAVLSILERDQLVERARMLGQKLGSLLRRELDGHPNVAEVRGMGLLYAVEFVKDSTTLERFEAHHSITAKLVSRALKRGVFFYPGGTEEMRDIICLGPPFITQEWEIELMVSVLRRSIDETFDRI